MSQNDGLDPHKKTVNCDKSTDYALQYFENIPEWKNPVKVPPREMPWICPEREENQCWNKLSFAAKYVNYEMSPRFIDLDDPFVVQKCNEIRKVEKFDPSKKKKKKKDVVEGQDIFQTIQPKNVPVKKDMNEMDDFLDEYGNIKEKGDSIQSPWKDLDSEEKSDQTTVIAKKPTPNKTPQGIITPKVIDKAISHAAEPRKSYLNVEEQKNYLPLYIQFWEKRHSVNQSNCLDRRNYSLFSHYIETVRNEQIEFSNFVKNVWYETDHVKKLVVRDDVRKFVDDYFENQIKDILGKLPHFYNNTNKFIRCSPSNPLEEFDLVLESNLLELGIIPKIIIPTQQALFQNVKITTGPEKMKELLNKERQIRLSEDPNIESLAKKVLPDIVVSSNPLKTIFNNFGPCYDRRWCIPLVVKKIDSKMVYYFEKTLPEPPPLSSFKKMTIFIKILGKRFLTHPWSQSKRNSDTTHSGGENDNDDIFGDTDHTLTESFGENLSQLDGNDDELDNQHNNSNSNPSINAESKKPANEVNPSQKDTLDLGSILESQKNAHKCTEDVKKPSLRITSQYDGAAIDRSDIGDPTEYTQPRKGNVMYKLWRLKKKESNSHITPQCGGLVNDIKVLIRCSIHGIRPTGKKKNNKFPEVMTISTKLDNQWNYGAEVATKSERAKDWMSNFIRPGSINCRLRVRNSYEICTCEIKSLPALTHDANGVDFIPIRQLGHLYEVFDGVMKNIKEEGTYLLLHDENSGPFLRLYKSIPTETKDPNLDLNSRLNLEEYKIDKPLSSKGIPWIPLDFSIVTSWHKKNNRVPGLFEPDSNFKSPSINRKRKRGGGGRGRGRGIKTAQLKN
ncbi:uncharacterized protein [Lepeophtheirus salmonis]|uniref:uncharacterized protein n=1 Tax=Lepeophtheirus salmonis TaxID=72036 RepID=UPI001AE3DED1|nr:little elongation complex subunit 2-like [Lepeophtheirus salmonis]